MDVVKVSWWHPGLALTRAALGLPGILGAVVCGGCVSGLFGSAAGWVFGGLAAGVAAFFAYVAAARLVNSTAFHFGADELVVTHGPLPWLPGPTLARDRVLGFDLTFDEDADLADVPAEVSRLATPRHPLTRRPRGPSIEGAALTALWRSLAPSWSVEVVVVGGEMYPVVDGLARRDDAVRVLEALRAWHGRAPPPSELRRIADS